MKTKTIKKRWKHIRVCYSCKEPMPRGVEVYSRGICPYCGHNSNSTICETHKVVYRKVLCGEVLFTFLGSTFLNPFKMDTTYEAKGVDSYLWLWKNGYKVSRVEY